MARLRLTFIHFFFFNDTATTEIYTLSLHDALPIYKDKQAPVGNCRDGVVYTRLGAAWLSRSEEHTSELQSRQYLVCRLLLEKKKQNNSHQGIIVRLQTTVEHNRTDTR